jgi:hypothetical protein
MIPPSLRSLLEGIVDYAGLFPPARLPLNETIENFIAYRSEPFSWMVGQFVCPTMVLHETLPFDDALHATGRAVFATAIGRGGDDAREFVLHCEQDIAVIRDFNEKSSASRVVSYEVKLPKRFSHETGVAQSLQQIKRAADGLELFFEAPIAGEDEAAVRRTIGQISDSEAGSLKLRLGGAEKEAFPPAKPLANAIHLAASLKLRVKFTAGLHHPLPRLDHDLGAPMHGFINVFCASILARTQSISNVKIEEVLAQDDPRLFTFFDDSIDACGMSMSVQEIEMGRCFALSFGSCSVMEPVEDLRDMGFSF